MSLLDVSSDSDLEEGIVEEISENSSKRPRQVN